MSLTQEDPSIPMKNPRKRKDIITQTAGNETLLYDPLTEKVHVLNQTALMVWEMCDGQHSSQLMADQLQQRFSNASGDILEQVTTVLNLLRKEKLLEEL